MVLLVLHCNFAYFGTNNSQRALILVPVIPVTCEFGILAVLLLNIYLQHECIHIKNHETEVIEVYLKGMNSTVFYLSCMSKCCGPHLAFHRLSGMGLTYRQYLDI